MSQDFDFNAYTSYSPGFWDNAEDLFFGGRQQNAYQAKVDAQYNAWQADLTRDFNAAEAQKNRDFQLEMSNTAYQRAMSDMRAAGLNPFLAYSNGGASTPTGSAASSSAASSSGSRTTSGNFLLDLVRVGASIAFSAYGLSKAGSAASAASKFKSAYHPLSPGSKFH